MSVSQKFVSDPQNVERVISLYLSDTKPTVEETAAQTRTTYHNVGHILKRHLPPEQFKFEKALRYSRSKMGEQNPMTGQSGSLHHNYIGEVETKDGYLQVKVNGQYELVHRQMMAEELGLERLPPQFEVHHINEQKQDNRLDNLALVTPTGHRTLHAKWSPSERRPLWERWESGISK